MRRVSDSPISQALLFSALYGVFSGAIILLSNMLSVGLEAPWTWQWALWAAVFAPAVITVVFAAASTSPAWSTLKWLYVSSLVIILALMEMSWIADARLGIALMVAAVACIVVAALFRLFGKRSTESE